MNQTLLAGPYATTMSHHHPHPHPHHQHAVAAASDDLPISSSYHSVALSAQAPAPQNPRHGHGSSPQQRQNSMAAPPPPLTPSFQTQATGSSTAGSSPRIPLSPNSQTREQERVTLLLEINVYLLQEVHRLQAEGKGGATSPQQQAHLKQQGQPDSLASEEYIQCLRRIQANLGYLMPKAQNDPQKMPQGPMHMSPPPHMPQLRIKYDQLVSLFPGWSGIDNRSAFSSGSPNPNSINGIIASPVSMGPT